MTTLGDHVTISQMDPTEAMQMQRDIGRLEGRMEGLTTATLENTRIIGSVSTKVSWMMGVGAAVAAAVSLVFNVVAKKMGLT